MLNQSVKKIAIIASAPMTISVFLAHQVNELSKIYKVTIITNMQGELKNTLDNLPASIVIHSIPIQRNINIFKDIKALFLIYKFYRLNKFNLVHSITPKAGLFSAIAGWVTRTPHRLHTFTGQVWRTRSGITRFIFKFIDILIVYFTTTILADSFSQRDFLIDQGILKKNTSIVLEQGSISGVDLERFYPDQSKGITMRSKLNISQSSLLFIFVGRIKKDKGLIDLMKAFNILLSEKLDCEMLIVGPDEENLKEFLINELSDNHKKVHFIPFSRHPEYYLMASDIFVLPSYREGFGTAVIEAAACGIPTIASNIYGLSDAVKDGESGLLFDSGSVKELANAMIQLALNDELRISLGKKALHRVQLSFSQKLLTKAIIDLYARLLQKNKKALA
jgi:glycosyltransferase involved in cell wall biosynthesis|tara:strand:- start:9253 stop:10428 length:1176 start_codon:yes stop_codon:yes gene_type:complete